MRALLIFLTIFFCSTLGTAGELFSRAESCSCGTRVERFEEPIRFGFGPFRGRCVSSCKFRRAIELPSGEDYGADESHVVIANFLHHGRFWIARVPVHEVAAVDIEFEKFLSVVSHVVLRFHFRNGIDLYRQDERAHGNPDAHTPDLILSAEAVPPKNHPFIFQESSLGMYLLAYRVLSIDENVDWMVISNKHTVKQYGLDLDPDEREHLVRAALHESEKKSFQTAYQLLTNNCSTSLMRFLMREVKYQPTVFDQLDLVGIQSAIPLDAPVGTLFALSAMKLVPRPLPNLEQEFKSFAANRASVSPLYK